MDRLTAVITGKVLAFDTSPLIYYIEQHPQYLQATDYRAGDFSSQDGAEGFRTIAESTSAAGTRMIV